MTGTSIHEPLRGQHGSKMKGAVGLMTAATLAMGGLLAASNSAIAAGTPALTAEVTEVPHEGIDVAIEATGFDDVKALPGQSAPGAYLMVIDKEADLADVTDTATSISLTIDEDGNFTDALNMSIDELDEDTDYEVITWPNRSFPTESNMYARTDIDIDWDVLLDRDSELGEDEDHGNENDEGEESPEETSKSFTAKASAMTEDNELVIDILGSGYGDVQTLPGQSSPGAYFGLIEKDSDLADVTQDDEALSAAIDEDGNITETWLIKVESVDPEKDYEVISWPTRSNPSAENLYGRTDLEIDWDALGQPGNEDDEEAPVATPKITTSVTEIADERIDIAIEGRGFDDVEMQAGQDSPVAYFTLVEKGAELSAVGQDATAVSADINDHGELSTVLTVDAEELDASKEYELISWPARAMPTEDNLFARADVTIDWEALFPAAGPEPTPDPSGEPTPEPSDPSGEPSDEPSDVATDIVVSVNDSTEASVRQGEDVTFSVAPVIEGTEFNVTVESDPIELDAVTADESNIASSTWTIPEDFELGEHTVTFANDDLGSFVGTFTVTEASAPAGDNGDDAGNSAAVDNDNNGSVTTAGDQTGGTHNGLATTGASMTAAAILALLMVVVGAMIVAKNRKTAAAETEKTSV